MQLNDVLEASKILEERVVLYTSHAFNLYLLGTVSLGRTAVATRTSQPFVLHAVNRFWRNTGGLGLLPPFRRPRWTSPTQPVFVEMMTRRATRKGRFLRQGRNGWFLPLLDRLAGVTTTQPLIGSFVIFVAIIGGAHGLAFQWLSFTMYVVDCVLSRNVLQLIPWLELNLSWVY